jgi:hypothetical protein
VTNTDADEVAGVSHEDQTDLDRVGLAAESERLRTLVRQRRRELDEFAPGDEEYEQRAEAVLKATAELVALEEQVPGLVRAQRHRRAARWVYPLSAAAGLAAVGVGAAAIVADDVAGGWFFPALLVLAVAVFSVLAQAGSPRADASMAIAAAAALVVTATLLVLTVRLEWPAWWAIAVIFGGFISFGAVMAADDELSRTSKEA